MPESAQEPAKMQKAGAATGRRSHHDLTIGCLKHRTQKFQFQRALYMAKRKRVCKRLTHFLKISGPGRAGL
jgi:hypothetical protein